MIIYSDGTSLEGDLVLPNGKSVNADEARNLLMMKFTTLFPINVQNVVFMKNHRCAVCPVDCCVSDEDIVETEEELLVNKNLCIQKINSFIIKKKAA